jgi:glycosyltransferase involved in cell wall biosynthesis
MSPLFSIVMPVLNAGEFVERALRSVLAQAGDDTEVIVVDGGSTDGSVEVIEKLLRSRSERNSWSSEPDGGQSAALNKGFARARGRYLLWINADDLLLPGTLDRAREHLRKHPECSWLAGNMVYIDAQDRVLRVARDGRWHDWLYRHAPVRVYGPTSIFSRELFERVGGFDESLHYAMDTDLWLRFKAAGARFDRLSHLCWAFRVHDGSKTAADLHGAADPRMLEERARVYAKNGLRVTRFGLWQQRIWRLLNGCYLRAWWQTYCDHPVVAMTSVKTGEQTGVECARGMKG